MRAGEDPTNTVPGNKTAREQGYARLVKLLKGLKGSSGRMIARPRGVLAKTTAKPAMMCHDAS
jgi:carboxymethylenebutenolidase